MDLAEGKDQHSLNYMSQFPLHSAAFPTGAHPLLILPELNLQSTSLLPTDVPLTISRQCSGRHNNGLKQ